MAPHLPPPLVFRAVQTSISGDANHPNVAPVPAAAGRAAAANPATSAAAAAAAALLLLLLLITCVRPVGVLGSLDVACG